MNERRSEIEQIRKTIAAIREDVLPIGHTVNTSITLATCHGDLDYIESRLNRLEKSIRAARDAEIRELLLSDGAKNASAHRMQELSAQGVWRNHTLAFYGMKAALEHIGMAEEGAER